MRLFIIENGLKDTVGHHYHEAIGLQREARRRGIETRFYVHWKAIKEIVAALDARPVFSFRPYAASEDSLCGPLEDLFHVGERFAAECSALVDDGLTRDDIVYVATTMQNEVYGCARWLRALSKDETPFIVMNFKVENYLDGDTHKAHLQAALYRFAAKALAAHIPDERIFFTAGTDAFAKRLGQLTLRPVFTYPMPVSYDLSGGQAGTSRTVDPARPVVVSILGHSREEKGWLLIPEIVRLCTETNREISFFIQISPENMARAWKGSYEKLRAMANVKFHVGPARETEYMEFVRQSDIVLLPYDYRAFTGRTSGVFAESIGFGKVAVVPRGTWMAEQLRNNRGAGTVFEQHTPESIAAAVGEAMARIDGLRAKADHCADAWRREEHISTFLDRMLSDVRGSPETGPGRD